MCLENYQSFINFNFLFPFTKIHHFWAQQNFKEKFVLSDNNIQPSKIYNIFSVKKKSKQNRTIIFFEVVNFKEMAKVRKLMFAQMKKIAFIQ